MATVRVVMALPISAAQPAELFVTARAGHMRAAAILLDWILTRRTTFNLNKHGLRWQSSFVVA